MYVFNTTEQMIKMVNFVIVYFTILKNAHFKTIQLPSFLHFFVQSTNFWTSVYLLSPHWTTSLELLAEDRLGVVGVSWPA